MAEQASYKTIFNNSKAESQGIIRKLSLNSKVTLKQPVLISNAAYLCQLLTGKDHLYSASETQDSASDREGCLSADT